MIIGSAPFLLMSMFAAAVNSLPPAREFSRG
jgi:hypothetical protein